MSKEFNELICKIFELKKEKSNYISVQSYEKAAQKRDEERKLERKLLAIEGIMVEDVDELAKQMNLFFNKYFQMEYSLSYKEYLHKQFI